ncbi:uncharacterized protein AB675_1753 [Cyphellophora attinorum]|uniref:DUF985 domain-containing protein n=1 Tax=Cyphellophora attinorum TaxID=1664694 RepID=A0A0N0NQ00_9EURO|nr:uncharacterized protein AB675_1753 [Phialophora attinorum]KPI43109.1 hypothetical protein AB675_1753 [Phialophora attinorum]
MPPTADEIIKLLSLDPHPEGGFFRETFHDEPILPTSPLDTISGTLSSNAPTALHNRAASTLIYYLLPYPHFSSLHRIDAAEGWHYYTGTIALEVVELDPPILSAEGSVTGSATGKSAQPLRVTRLGVDFASGERPQYVVQKGKWFGARLPKEAKEGDWVLVGCSVAPGFVFEGGFEMGRRDVLEREFQGVGNEEVANVIREMCRE